MNQNNKPKTFKDQAGKMDQSSGKINTQPNQSNKNSGWNDKSQNGGFKKPDVHSTEKVEKTNGQPNKFNNFKK